MCTNVSLLPCNHGLAADRVTKLRPSIMVLLIGVRRSSLHLAVRARLRMAAVRTVSPRFRVIVEKRMRRGRLLVILLLVLFAGHPVAGLVCEATCEPAAPAQPEQESAGCHAAAADRGVPSVRVSAADEERCEHGSVREALTAERWQSSDSRVQSSGAIDTTPGRPHRESHELPDNAPRYSPPGPRVGFGLPIRV